MTGSNLCFQMLYENDFFRVFYKPCAVHSTQLNDNFDSCVSLYTKMFGRDDSFYQLNGNRSKEFGLLYRLDFVTSGLILFAKKVEFLLDLLKSNILKTYEALSTYSSEENKGLFLKSEYIRLSEKLKKERFVEISSYFRSFNGRYTKPVLSDEVVHYRNKKISTSIYTTSIRMIEKISDIYKFTVSITKGFRHQIRTTLSALNFPILNDVAYGGEISNKVHNSGIGLICRRLDFSFRGREYTFDLGELLKNG